MNRLNAYIIKSTEPIVNYLLDVGTNFEAAEPCPQLNEKVLFVTKINKDLLALEPIFLFEKHGMEPVFFYDNGLWEVEVKGNNYTKYDLNALYFDRTGKYDIIESV